jgi:hypothetical protein
MKAAIGHKKHTHRMTDLTKKEILFQLKKMGIQSPCDLNIYYEGYREYSENPSREKYRHAVKRRGIHHTRTHERMPVNLKVRYLVQQRGYRFQNIYTGIIKDLSEKGMFIRTASDVPDEPFIPDKKNLVYIPARINRIAWRRRTPCSSYNGIGIELTLPPQEYKAFVDKIKADYNAEKTLSIFHLLGQFISKFSYRLRHTVISG